MRFKFGLLPAFALFAFTVANPCQAQDMTVAPDRPDGIYHVGDTVHWLIGWQGGSNAPAARYLFEKGGLTKAGQGELKLSRGSAQLDSKFESPGTLLLVVTWQDANGKEQRALGGAVAAPGRIPLSAPPPADFDTFWKARIQELQKTPAAPKLEKEDSGKPGVRYWKITLNNIRGTHIEGQIARPEAGGKFPALLILQWAGVYGLQKSWVTDRAAEGWLALNLEPHDLPIDKPASFYQEQFDGPLKDYWSLGNDNRDTSYFLRMYLSCYRAVEYLKTRRDWNRKTLVVMGDSQGGQQTLMIAGLHPKDITAALALVPAGCDLLGPEIGRAPGWPHWYDNTDGKDPVKVREAGRYYDTANFAPHIKCPVLIGLGLIDETCPPAGVLAAANQITSPKQIVILPKSGHQDFHGSQAPYNQLRYRVWLSALREGRPPPVKLNAGLN